MCVLLPGKEGIVNGTEHIIVRSFLITLVSISDENGLRQLYCVMMVTNCEIFHNRLLLYNYIML